MGGHGGLNILPQKRWNVYNQSNRQKVEKDLKKERQKQLKQKEQELAAQGSLRIDILKKKKKVKKEEDQVIIKQHNQLNQELQGILNAQQNMHVNFFEDEEKILNQKLETTAKLQKDEKFFEDKPYDLSSKFMQSMDNKNYNKQLWYLNSNSNKISECSRLEKNHKIGGTKVGNTIHDFYNTQNNYFVVLNSDKQKELVNNEQPIKQNKHHHHHKRSHSSNSNKSLEKHTKKHKKDKKKYRKEEENKLDKKQRKQLKKERKQQKQLEKERAHQEKLVKLRKELNMRQKEENRKEIQLLNKLSKANQ